MQLTPKTKRNISRIIPFGLIWLACSWIFVITELAVTRNKNLNPETDVAFTLPVLLFANMAILMVGLLVGTIEMVYLEKRLAHFSLARKFGVKFLVYFTLFLLVILVTYPIAFSIEQEFAVSAEQIWEKQMRFLGSMSFLSTLFQLSVCLIASLIYAAVSENLGHSVFLNFFTGRYHKPIVEERVFMFLDMKSSTTIAEALGHVRYFELLQTYYKLMSDPIINSYGEVYQYIGDEIVVSWKLEKGLENAHCLRCFFAIKDSIGKQQQKLRETYGFDIGFKAGIHFGEVSIGEVGALKREIVFAGDVLNTTARIQGQCNLQDSDLLVSGKLKNRLPSNSYSFISKEPSV